MNFYLAIIGLEFQFLSIMNLVMGKCNNLRIKLLQLSLIKLDISLYKMRFTLYKQTEHSMKYLNLSHPNDHGVLVKIGSF